jgi:hypothetical protein
MSPENSKLIYKAAIKAGDILKGKLPASHMHPNGRNSHAHVFERLKNKLGMSYKDCEDSETDSILRFIFNCSNNPS